MAELPALVRAAFVAIKVEIDLPEDDECVEPVIGSFVFFMRPAHDAIHTLGFYPLGPYPSPRPRMIAIEAGSGEYLFRCSILRLVDHDSKTPGDGDQIASITQSEGI